MSHGRYDGSIPQAGQVCSTTFCACDRSGVEMLTAVEKCGFNKEHLFCDKIAGAKEDRPGRAISATFMSLKHGRLIPGHPDYKPT